MKWLKQAILVIFMLSTVFGSCPQSMLITRGYSNVYPQMTIVDKVYKSKNDYLQIDVTIPQIKNLPNEDKEKNINNLITTWTEEWINDAKYIADEYFKNGTPPLNPYQLNAKYKVTNLKKVISLYIDYYQYTGGAHGVTTRKSYNIDKILPGITGWAQINGRDNIGNEEKVKYDYEYLMNNSFTMDLYIIVMTALKVLKRSDIKD